MVLVNGGWALKAVVQRDKERKLGNYVWLLVKLKNSRVVLPRCKEEIILEMDWTGVNLT